MHALIRFFAPVLLLLSLVNCRLESQEMIHPAESVSANLPNQQHKPYLILISLDGYRWDYTQRFRPPNLMKLINSGVKAESMIPCFPSKTFPNHYTIATGMRPESHGLVDNSFYDPARDQVYKINDRSKVEDGSWYGGTPIWVNAANNGMVTASYFFVGTEANIQGKWPTYYYKFNNAVPHNKRVEQAIKWLQMPAAQRPHLITLYFSTMDDIGHRSGATDDEPLQKGLMQLDKELGQLFDGLKKLNLPVNFIIVSDHGMSDVRNKNLLDLGELQNDEKYKMVNGGTLVHLYLKDTTTLSETYADLWAKAKNFKVFKTQDSLIFKANPLNPRLGHIVLVADHGFAFADHEAHLAAQLSPNMVKGHHGYDPAIKEQHGIFYAAGPAFKSKLTIPSFENIHVYPLMCKLLGLPVPKEVEGRLEVLEGVLR